MDIFDLLTGLRFWLCALTVYGVMETLKRIVLPRAAHLSAVRREHLGALLGALALVLGAGGGALLKVSATAAESVLAGLVAATFSTTIHAIAKRHLRRIASTSEEPGDGP